MPCTYYGVPIGRTKFRMLGQALFTIVAAAAQLERDLIRERVSAGLRNAKAAGKQLGRPKRIVDRHKILRLQAEGASNREISAKLNVGYGTVRKRPAAKERAETEPSSSELATDPELVFSVDR